MPSYWRCICVKRPAFDSFWELYSIQVSIELTSYLSRVYFLYFHNMNDEFSVQDSLVCLLGWTFAIRLRLQKRSCVLIELYSTLVTHFRCKFRYLRVELGHYLWRGCAQSPYFNFLFYHIWLFVWGGALHVYSCSLWPWELNVPVCRWKHLEPSGIRHPRLFTFRLNVPVCLWRHLEPSCIRHPKCFTNSSSSCGTCCLHAASLSLPSLPPFPHSIRNCLGDEVVVMFITYSVFHAVV